MQVAKVRSLAGDLQSTEYARSQQSHLVLHGFHACDNCMPTKECVLFVLYRSAVRQVAQFADNGACLEIIDAIGYSDVAVMIQKHSCRFEPADKNCCGCSAAYWDTLDLVVQTTRCAALAGVDFNGSLLTGRLAMNNGIGNRPEKPGSSWPQQARIQYY